MSIVIVATITPKPEYTGDVIAALERAEDAVHEAEEGCLLYALHETADGSLVMIEKYADQAAFEAHGAGPALKALIGDLNGKLVSPLDVKILTPHPAGSPDKGVL
jgi:quinol monooxygenase YgiN